MANPNNHFRFDPTGISWNDTKRKIERWALKIYRTKGFSVTKTTIDDLCTVIRAAPEAIARVFNSSREMSILNAMVRRSTPMMQVTFRAGEICLSPFSIVNKHYKNEDENQ